MYKVQLIDSHGKVMRELTEVHLSVTVALHHHARISPDMTLARFCAIMRIVKLTDKDGYEEN